MNSTKEKVSYCIGLETGKRLRHQFGEIDLECLKKGFTDAVFDSYEIADASGAVSGYAVPNENHSQGIQERYL